MVSYSEKPQVPDDGNLSKFEPIDVNRFLAEDALSDDAESDIEKSSSKVKIDRPTVSDEIDYKAMYMALKTPPIVTVKAKRVATEKQKLALAAGRAGRKGKVYKKNGPLPLPPPPPPTPPPSPPSPVRLAQIESTVQIEHQEPPPRRALSYRVV